MVTRDDELAQARAELARVRAERDAAIARADALEQELAASVDDAEKLREVAELFHELLVRTSDALDERIGQVQQARAALGVPTPCDVCGEEHAIGACPSATPPDDAPPDDA
jgi:DNA repair exonuclease SbcCD ATPase subunit